MRTLLGRTLLKREDIALFRGDVIFDALRFTINGSDVFHIVFLSFDSVPRVGTRHG